VALKQKSSVTLHSCDEIDTPRHTALQRAALALDGTVAQSYKGAAARDAGAIAAAAKMDSDG